MVAQTMVRQLITVVNTSIWSVRWRTLTSQALDGVGGPHISVHRVLLLVLVQCFVATDAPIELAFCLLKEHLQLSQLWSAKWEVVQVQIWCDLLLAQLFHGLQVLLAAQEGVDPFDVSIDLLVEVVPRLLQQGIAPLPYLGQRGRELGLIRPSSRIQIEVPFVDPSWITPAPTQALQPREPARSAQRKCAPGPRPSAKQAG